MKNLHALACYYLFLVVLSFCVLIAVPPVFAQIAESVKSDEIANSSITAGELIGQTKADLGKRPYSLTEERATCDHYTPLRQVFWGDTHVHTAYSLDAGVQDTRNKPDDAYRYAKGERVGLQPFRYNGTPLRYAQISKPLDFTVVTDHGEALGIVGVCRMPKYKGYNSFPCKAFRKYPSLGFFLMVRFPVATRRLALRYDALYALKNLSDPDAGLPPFCGADSKDCIEASMTRWADIKAAAERAYDRSSACTFTSFAGYEWTGNVEVNLHRNIIFRNERTTVLPISYVQASTAERLLHELSEQCLERDDGCDVLSIPHNSNLSEGRMFPRPESFPLTYSAQDARDRARLEPLIEIMQHKGDSECWHGQNTQDEFCAFEKLPYRSFGGKFFTSTQRPSQAEDGYVRDILYQGLRFQRLIDANPYQLGLIAASDTHLGTPGAVEEWQHQGHGGAGVSWSSKLLDTLPDDIEYNPGGLMGVWAEENSRDAIFEAMRRREVYGTSGPRIAVRMFAIADNAGVDDLCAAPDRVATAYKNGVPMGSNVKASQSVRIFVEATGDPGVADRDGAKLQRIQVIKGWLAKDGKRREKVVDIAGGDNNAGVDEASCKPHGRGETRMCAVWEDTDFNSTDESYYYARVLENPSCRWNSYICIAQQVNCAVPEDVPPGFEQCCSEEYPRVIQERAWTSPVWYVPSAP